MHPVILAEPGSDANHRTQNDAVERLLDGDEPAGVIVSQRYLLLPATWPDIGPAVSPRKRAPLPDDPHS
jgi:hypothetical protein